MAKRSKSEVPPDANPDDFVPITAPEYFSSSFQISRNSNQVTIVFRHYRPLLHKSRIDIGAALQEPIAVVVLSPQSAKDLALLLSRQVEEYEEEWGNLNTEFTKTQAKKKNGN